MKSQLFSRKQVLIIGANGFLGRHLAETIAAENPGRLTLLSRTSISSLPEGANAVTLNLLDREATNSFFQDNRFDFVYNLAGKIDQRIWPGVYNEQFQFHVQTTLNITDALLQNPPVRFFHFGSSMEYGNAPYPQVNREREYPLSAYGVSKLASTKVVLARTRSEQLPGVVIRPFLIYGLGQGSQSFLESAIRAAREGQDFPTTEGSQTRDFTPVSKFVEDTLAVTALPDTTTIGEIFNVCTGVEIYVREVIEILQAHYPSFRPNVGALKYRTSEVMHSVGDAFQPWSVEQTRSELVNFLTASR